MADNDTKPIIKLGPEIRAQLSNLTGDIGATERAIETLKKIGMETRELEDKLNWAKNVRSTLLEEFG